jgi:hypothetical protein
LTDGFPVDLGSDYRFYLVDYVSEKQGLRLVDVPALAVVSPETTTGSRRSGARRGGLLNRSGGARLRYAALETGPPRERRGAKAVGAGVAGALCSTYIGAPPERSVLVLPIRIADPT